VASTASVNNIASTGVPGLDHVLISGLPRNRLYLIEGEPGAGKTTLGLQFLLAGRDAGERVMYINLSETNEELRLVAASHGWSLDGMDQFELSALEQQLKMESQNTLFHPNEIELNETTNTILAEVDRIKPARVVFDSLSELRLMAQSPLRYRRQLLALKQFFSGRGCTVMLLDDRASNQGDQQVKTLAHGVISLEKFTPNYGAERRRLHINKLRGVAFRGGMHDFNIERGGLRVFPRIVALETRRLTSRDPVVSGVAGLDQLLGGGLDRGTSTLLMGAAGSGKSTLSCLYALAACKRGEPAAVFLFDESSNTFHVRSKSLGMDTAKYTENGLLNVRQIDPAELSAGEFSQLVRDAVEIRKASVVIIDSLTGYLQAMPDERSLLAQFHELLTYLGQHDVATILIMGQSGLIGSAMQAPVDVSYLADTVVLFRYFENAGRIRKAISVVKKRAGYHESHIREYSVSSAGVNVGEPLTKFRGILTGVPEFCPGTEPTIEKEKQSAKP
jgi:circadian clock protein KaiC